MKIEWKKTGGSFVTLGDDTAASRQTILIDQWDCAAQVQVDPLVRSTHPFAEPRANVSGNFAFRATKSHATLDAAVEAFDTEYQRAGEAGELKITTTAKVINYTNAILVAVARGDKQGVRLEVQYQFLIRARTIT